MIHKSLGNAVHQFIYYTNPDGTEVLSEEFIATSWTIIDRWKDLLQAAKEALPKGPYLKKELDDFLGYLVDYLENFSGTWVDTLWPTKSEVDKYWRTKGLYDYKYPFLVNRRPSAKN